MDDLATVKVVGTEAEAEKHCGSGARSRVTHCEHDLHANLEANGSQSQEPAENPEKRIDQM